MHSRTLLPLLAAGWLVLPGGPARADEWVVDSAVATRLTYNDNLNMQLVNPVSATSFSLAPSAKFSSRTESRDLRFGAGLSANYYFEESSNNAVDYNFDLGSKWKRELNDWSLGVTSLRNSTLNNEPTRNSELSSTGVVTARRQRTQNSLSGAWSHIVGDSTQAFVSANGAQVRYERGPGLVDYDNNSMALGINHAWSDRTVLTASYSYLTYDTVDSVVDVKTNADSLMLGGAWQYSERLSFGLSAGSQKTHSEQKLIFYRCLFSFGGVCLSVDPTPIPFVVRSESSGSTYAANTNYGFESGSLSASVSRGLTASGTGALLRTDLAALSYSHQYDETLSLGIGGTMTKSRNPNAGTGDTRFSSLSSSLTWRLDRDLSFNAAYSHSTQRAPGQAESAKVNVVVFSLSWDLRPLSTSK
jgi:hypothetical protein